MKIAATFLLIVLTFSNSIKVNSGKLEISVDMIDANNVKFTLSVSSGDWVGIGFGSNMKDVDMFYVSGGTFHDAYSTTESTPSDDSD